MLNDGEGASYLLKVFRKVLTKRCLYIYQESVERIFSPIFILPKWKDPESENVSNDASQSNGQEEDPAHPEVKPRNELISIFEFVVTLQNVYKNKLDP